MDNRVLFMSNRVPFGITMKRLIFIAFSALFVAPATAATFGPLVSPTDLNAELDSAQPILLDIRGEAYEKEGHIVGAISAPYGIFRGPKENPGQLLEVATLEERYEALGLELERPVVIVPEGATDTDFGAAARVYWTLKSSGFSDLSILNGGVRSWVSAGLSLEKSASTLPATELDIEFSQAWTADTEAVVAATRGEIDSLLLDARPDAFYQGKKAHDAAAKPGTIPGASNQDYTAFFDKGSSAIKQSIDGSPLLETLGVSDGQEIVSFCNTGHWAATNWFALSEVAGLDNVKLYPGSMVEYSNAGHEMENAPGLIGNFLNKLKGN